MQRMQRSKESAKRSKKCKCSSSRSMTIYNSWTRACVEQSMTRLKGGMQAPMDVKWPNSTKSFTTIMIKTLSTRTVITTR